MHTPDGFLHPWMAGAFLLLAGVVLAAAAIRSRRTLTGRRVQLFGVVAAAVFAFQMLDWPIPGGTSAHFVGGAFAAILLGPHLGALAVSVVVAVQALVFGDGGALALGANAWNMAIVQVYVGYATYVTLQQYGESVAVVASGWVGIALAAASAGLQLGLSPAFGGEFVAVLTVMVGGHAVLGLGEGLCTLLGVRLFERAGSKDESSAVAGASA